MNIVILGYYCKQLVIASAAGFRLDLQLQVVPVFLASIVVYFRILSLVTSLLLTVQLCSRPQPLSGRPGDGGSLSVVRPPMTDAPVDRLIQALLDTGTTGWAAPTDSITPAAATVLGLLADAPTFKLRIADYGWPRLRALRDSLAQPATAGTRAARQVRFDVYPSDAVLFFPDLYLPDEAPRQGLFAPVPKPVAAENRGR